MNIKSCAILWYSDDFSLLLHTELFASMLNGLRILNFLSFCACILFFPIFLLLGYQQAFFFFLFLLLPICLSIGVAFLSSNFQDNQIMSTYMYRAVVPTYWRTNQQLTGFKYIPGNLSKLQMSRLPPQWF